jgi:hypothetical protein
MITTIKGANMLIQQQQVYLQSVAKHGVDEIDKVTRMLHRMSPELFLNESKAAMKERKFFDQPASLILGDDYASHEVDMVDGHERYAIHEARSIKVLRRGMGYK